MLLRSKNIVWFEGVVENINDPLKLFRVQVRIYGLYTANKTDIPTEDLHWAQVGHPVTSAAMNGIGHTPSFVKGTHVAGYFRDGDSCQDPIVTNTIAGIPTEEPKPNTGFFDPDLVYPKRDWLGEPDTSRLARAENIDKTIVQTKRDQRIENKKVPGGTVSQPTIPYAAEYPYNKTWETESGHVIEMDDTKGHERVAITHKSGSFIEMHPDGTVTIKSVKDRFDITTANESKIVGDSQAVHVTSNAKLYVGGDYDIEVAGSVNMKIAKDYAVTVGGDSLHDTQGDNIVQASTIFLN